MIRRGKENQKEIEEATIECLKDLLDFKMMEEEVKQRKFQHHSSKLPLALTNNNNNDHDN